MEVCKDLMLHKLQEENESLINAHNDMLKKNQELMMEVENIIKILRDLSDNIEEEKNNG